jgi:hypothetical protein
VPTRGARERRALKREEREERERLMQSYRMTNQHVVALENQLVEALKCMSTALEALEIELSRATGENRELKAKQAEPRGWAGRGKAESGRARQGRAERAAGGELAKWTKTLPIGSAPWVRNSNQVPGANSSALCFSSAHKCKLVIP